MYYKLILILQITRFSIANLDNDFIVRYFQYKAAPYVVGFLCNNLTDEVELMKNFSGTGIYTSFDKLYLNFTLKPFTFSFNHKVGVIYDSRCYNATENDYLLSTAGKLNFYAEMHYWLILTTNLNNTINMLDDTMYSLSTDLVIAVVGEREILLYDVFNLCKYRGGLLNVTKMGRWNSVDGFNITLTQSKFSRRANYHGMLIRMAAIYLDKSDNVPIENYLKDYDSKQNDTAAKFAYEAWEHIADLFNLTIEVKEIPATRVANRYAPVIKALCERSAEVSGNTALLVPERIALISPSPAWPLQTCFIFRTTQSKRIKVNHFLRPLANAAWYLTILFSLIVMLVFAWVLMIENDNKFERYSNSLLFTIGSLCQQGTDLQVSSASCRIAILQTMIFSLLLYNYYSASIVSARLSEPLEKINDSLNELAKLNLKFGAEPLLYFNVYIKRSDWEGQQFYKRWLMVPENERFLPAREGMMRVLQGGYAYHTDVNVAYPLIERLFENQQVCQLTMVHLVPPTDSSILTALNGSFVEMTRVGVARVRENGLRARLIHKWAARTPRCRSDLLDIDPLTIYEVAIAFFLLLSGVVLGLFIFFFEILVYWKKNHNKNFLQILKPLQLKFFAKNNNSTEQ